MPRIKIIKALLFTTALATTACTSTTAPTATAIKGGIPPVSTELLLQHERPERPSSGSPEQLLHHAVRYGAYCQKLESQVSGWQAWYGEINRD